MVRLLLERRVRDGHPEFKPEALFAAIEHPHIMALLLQHGMDPDTLDPDGASPLRLAVAQNKPEIVRLLLHHGVTLDQRTNPLHVAAFLGHQEIVGMLISHFPLLARTKDKYQCRPLDCAMVNGQHELIRALLPHTPMQPIGFYSLCEQIETEDKNLKKHILIEGFSRYIQQRQQEFKPLSTFFSDLGRGYAEREKIAVATKVLEFLKTDAAELELEPRELQVLDDGRLSWLRRAVRDFLEPEFEITKKTTIRPNQNPYEICPEEATDELNFSNKSPS